MAIVAIPETILALLIYYGGASPVTGLILFAGTILTSAAMIKLAAARYLGTPMAMAEAYTSISPGTYAVLVGAYIVVAIAVGLGFILLIIPGVYLAVRFAFVGQAVVLEQRGVFESLSRSGELVKDNWWRLFGIGLTFVIGLAIAEGIVQLVLTVIFHGLGGILAQNLVSPILFTPIEYIALTLLYFDLRIRKEGFQPAAAADVGGFQPV
jgi:hypothetical protein